MKKKKKRKEKKRQNTVERKQNSATRCTLPRSKLESRRREPGAVLECRQACKQQRGRWKLGGKGREMEWRLSPHAQKGAEVWVLQGGGPEPWWV